METKTVICRKVYDESGEYLKVEPYTGDGSSTIVLSKNYNSVQLIFSPEYAKLVANALYDCVGDLEEV